MSIITVVVMCFSVLGAIDCILNNKFGLGKEWERGFQLLGTMSLSMIGMIVLAPFISHILSPVLSVVAEHTVLEPSIIAGSLLANDMGGATLSLSLAENQEIGYFNGLIVAAMMGCTISFTLPLALGTVEKSKHHLVLMGLLYGIITIPVGCFVAGLVLGLSVTSLVLDLIPLVVLALLLVIGLLKAPEKCVKVFQIFGVGVKIIIMIGLTLGIITFLTGYEILPCAAPIEEGVMICFNAAAVMTGTFPLLHCVSRLLRRPLTAVAQKTGMNDSSALGFVASLATNVTTFSMMKDMDDRGVVLNSAFAVSGAFVFAGHLAFTMSFQADYVLGMIIGKLVAGILAVAIAGFATRTKLKMS